MDKSKIYTAYKPRKFIHIALWMVVALALLIASLVIGNFYTDYLEIKEIGEQFVTIFLKNLTYKALFSSIYFIFSFLLILVFTSIIKRNLKKALVESEFLERKRFTIIICALVAFVASTYMGETLYEKFLTYINSVSFNISDPILGLDLSYYLFKRPFFKMLIDGVSATFMFSIIYSAVAYFFLYIRIGERNIGDLIRNKSIMTHLIVAVLIYLFIKAVSVWINAQEILTGEFAGLTGAGFVDVKIRLNFYRIAPFIILAIAVAVLFFLIKKKYIPAIITSFLYIAILVILNIVCWSAQLLYVSPNEVLAESEYIKHNIDFTRMSYNIADTQEYEYEVSMTPSITSYDLTKDVIENIRIIDFPSTVTATNQLQGIRNYYYFKDMDVGIYNINGKKEAVAIGAREISKQSLDDTAKNYLNEKFRFTHGFGIAMAKIYEVTDKGQPEYLIENLIPEFKENVPNVTQPRIYFGQLTNDSVIVNTKISEFDYSIGTSDVEFDYDGPAGIKLNFLNKLIFAVRTGDFRMLIANQITPESRLLINRNIIERVYKVAPFFKYDSNPVIIIDDDGSLKWVIDAYTTSSEMPYSEYTNGYNYIRNSIKVTVDAYTGEVKFYIIDKNDPVVNVYKNIYPDLFSDSEIPQSIITKSKYPESLFNTQCKIYTKYHITDPTVFYNKSDMYAIANEKYDQDIRPVQPYYNIMRLNEFNENEPELVLMLPFTLVNRENMVSWIAVGNEGDNYGKLVSYKFPKDYTVYGPLQIENMIDNDPEISKEITLWDSGGSNVIRGNLLVIPFKDTILYVEPLYITTNNQASLPLLKRIIVGSGDNIVMSDTLEDALSKLFNLSIDVENPVDVPSPETDIPQSTDAVQNVIDAYLEVEQASLSGDWTNFGKAMDNLKKSISVLSSDNK